MPGPVLAPFSWLLCRRWLLRWPRDEMGAQEKSAAGMLFLAPARPALLLAPSLLLLLFVFVWLGGESEREGKEVEREQGRPE